MSTLTETYTTTDVRKVFEMLQADLQMLALRTQAMDLKSASDHAYDISLMAQERCLKHVHIQLCDSREKLVRVHLYSVEENVLSESHRPGANRWPCLPDGTLHVLVDYSDHSKAEKLKNSGELKLNWTPSSLSTNYYGMRKESTRLYSSNSYGLQRDTFVN